MRPVGYLVNTSVGIQGESGVFYDYIIAGNGLFVQSRSPLLEARICIAPALVRGLSPVEQRISLPKGKIPKYLYELAISLLLTDRCRECYLAVTWNGEYHLKMPAQERGESKVIYSVIPGTLLDIHSHAGMDAFYSRDWDDVDEQGFRLSMVMGKMNTIIPEISLRIGVYGYYSPVPIDEVFDVHP